MFDPTTAFLWRFAGTHEEIDQAVRLLRRFESLGHDCEFGLVQRHLSLEPLGMFRWGGTHLNELVAMFDADFEGMDRAENHRLDLVAGEYYFVNTPFQLPRHTHVREDGRPDLAKLLAKQLMVTSFFVRQFRELLASGERIFVYKDLEGALPGDMVRLGQALQRRGPARLLVVHEHGRDNEEPTLERLADGVWLGHVDHYGNKPGGWDISLQSWLELLSRTLDEAEGAASQRSGENQPGSTLAA